MYVNRTGITSPIGKIVKLDKDGRGVLLALPADTAILGVVTSVVSGGVEVASDGARVVFINGVFKKGQIVYLKKSGQSGGLGTCYASASPTAPYVKIGTALELGSSRVAKIMMSIGAVSSSTGTTTGTVGPPGPQGADGKDGKDGITPIKGIDYFDGARGQDSIIPGPPGPAGKDGVTPVKGVDYFDGVNGYTPIKGVDYADGLNGNNGYTPIKNVDYFDGEKGDKGDPSIVPGPPGYTPLKGVDYFDGAASTVPGPPGYTPVKGADYFDGVKGDTGAPGSDATVTKVNVEAVLTGEISTHTHDMSGKLNVTAFTGLTKITVGSTPPSAPNVGDLYIDTN